jgi:hypothetical protein
MITNFLKKEWIDNRYLHGTTGLNGWWQPPASIYPYPMIIGMPIPDRFTLADSPRQPDQVDIDPMQVNPLVWQVTHPATDRALSPNFVNGSFTDWLIGDNSSFFNPSSFPNNLSQSELSFPNSPGRPGYIEDDGITPISPAIAPGHGGGSMGNGRWVYFLDNAVSGWSSRPVVMPAAPPAIAAMTGLTQAQRNTLTRQWTFRNAIEFQRPYNTTLPAGVTIPTPPSAPAPLPNFLYSPLDGRARVDHNGSSNGIYVELNAEIPGTLYQLLPTTPGQQFYYSFYHMTRAFMPTK